MYRSQLGESGHAVDDLAAVAARGAPAHPVGLDESDRVAALGQCQRGSNTGKSRADNADISRISAAQGGIDGESVRRGRII